MSADKYIRNNGGVLTEKAATDVSTGAASAGEIPALDNTGRLDLSMMPVGIGPDVYQLTASEALSAGDFINVWNDGGVAKVRKADATTAGKFAHGYVLAAVDLGDPATVYFEGTNTQVSGATPGQTFLSTTAGGFTSTAPSGAGNVVQRLGVAVSSTEINFERSQPIVLA
jgi:hypothetical protein